MKDHYIVSVPRVPGVTRFRMQTYIRMAVSAWGGQFEPVDGGYPDSKPNSGDPLGPPCVLLKKGAVVVKMVPRGTKPFTLKKKIPTRAKAGG